MAFQGDLSRLQPLFAGTPTSIETRGSVEGSVEIVRNNESVRFDGKTILTDAALYSLGAPDRNGHRRKSEIWAEPEIAFNVRGETGHTKGFQIERVELRSPTATLSSTGTILVDENKTLVIFKVKRAYDLKCCPIVCETMSVRAGKWKGKRLVRFLFEDQSHPAWNAG